MGVFNAYTGFEPVRLSAGRTYCSGTLIAADLCAHGAVETNLVLTCAHFFRTIKKIRISGPFSEIPPRRGALDQAHPSSAHNRWHGYCRSAILAGDHNRNPRAWFRAGVAGDRGNHHRVRRPPQSCGHPARAPHPPLTPRGIEHRGNSRAPCGNNL